MMEMNNLTLNKRITIPTLILLIAILALIIHLIVIPSIIRVEKGTWNVESSVKWPDEDKGPIQLTLKMTDSTFTEQETIQIQLELKNIGDERVELVFPSASIISVTIFDINQSKIIQFPLGGPIRNIHIILEPGKAEIRTFTWNQKDFNGENVTSGVYYVQAHSLLKYKGDPYTSSIQTDLVEFEIK